MNITQTRSFNTSADDSGASVRLHLSENPFGSSPAVQAAILAEVERRHVYPDPESADLRSLVAARYCVDPSMVLVGNGCDELILLAALAFLGPGRRGVTSGATFPGYRTSMSLAGAQVHEVPLRDLRCDLAALAAASREAGAVFLCNPHNPTGSVADPAELRGFLEDVAASTAIPVIDEAYIEFAEGATASAVDWVREGGRGIVLRTLSKAYGIAGLRVGFAIGPAGTIAELTRVACALPFRVNRFAQAAGLAALSNPGSMQRTVEVVREIRNQFSRGLDALGIEHLKSATNFVLVGVRADSAEVARALREDYRVLVRDCGPFGLPGWIRISMGRETEMAQVLEALESLLARPGLVSKPTSPLPSDLGDHRGRA
jgi:histidinol-phosphate aminotransferase